MSTKTRRIMNFRFDRYKDIEAKLEKMATKGLFLQECGAYFWTFEKGERKNLKYTVTYFSEGSIFNPNHTDNQQTYFEYAKAAGWDFITEFNQMQVFSSQAENPIPFETDEKERLENIKKCMRKSYIPACIVMIIVFSWNLLVQFNSFRVNPIDFISDSIGLISLLMIIMVIAYNVYAMLDYCIWCKRCTKSIASGGNCVTGSIEAHKVIDTIFIGIVYVTLVCFLLLAFSKIGGFGLLLSVLQIPLTTAIYWLSIKYLKKRKASAKLNRAISMAVLCIVTIVYLVCVVMLVINFGFNTKEKATYRTVDWQMNSESTYQFKLYSHHIPLTCEDLYGVIDYDYYSKEKKVDSTFLLKKTDYSQNSLPAKNSPPKIFYRVLESRFDFVNNLVKKEMLEVPIWQENTRFMAIDNKIFGTKEAYERYNDNEPTGIYILIFDEKIIAINMEDVATLEQIEIIKEKLEL